MQKLPRHACWQIESYKGTLRSPLRFMRAVKAEEAACEGAVTCCLTLFRGLCSGAATWLRSAGAIGSRLPLPADCCVPGLSCVLLLLPVLPADGGLVCAGTAAAVTFCWAA